MSIFIRNFRQWWQPPRPLAHRPEHRQVTFLELFYDLVYVVLISQLTRSLSGHIDADHLGNFAFLFIIVWWAWLNGTIYHELHGNDDIRTRVFTFMQMFCVAAMAIFAHDALGETSVGFALSFGAFQLILTFMWWRTGVHDRYHRPLSRPYSIAFLITTVLLIGSAFVDAPVRFYLWIVATGISIMLPLVSTQLGRNDPAIQAQIQQSRRATPSLVERFGLFTIIVLGEVIVGVVQGVAEQEDLTLKIGMIGALGMLVAISLWWLYFDFVSHRTPHTGIGWMTFWIYIHLPLTAGIATIGAAILNVIEQGEALPMEVRWLLVGAIATVLISIATLMRTLQTPDVHRQTYRTGQRAIILASIVILVLGFSSAQTIPLLVMITLLMLAPIVLGLKYWMREFELTEHKIT